MPVGNVPVSLRVGAGKPVAITVKVPAVPKTNVALFMLVIVGAWFTVSVKACVAAGETPFCAVIVIGRCLRSQPLECPPGRQWQA